MIYPDFSAFQALEAIKLRQTSQKQVLSCIYRVGPVMLLLKEHSLPY
jgi:hypothetical protein